MANNATAAIYGNLIRDPETKNVNGNVVCSFTVAVNTTNKKPDGTYDSNFYDCSLWGRPGANGELPAVIKYFTDRAQKGSGVVAWGELSQREYVGQDGINKARLSLRVTTANVVSKLKTAGAAQQQPRTAAPQPNFVPQEEEQLPF